MLRTISVWTTFEFTHFIFSHEDLLRVNEDTTRSSNYDGPVRIGYGGSVVRLVVRLAGQWWTTRAIEGVTIVILFVHHHLRWHMISTSL